MKTYQLYEPISLTPANFAQFAELKGAQDNGSLLPDRLAFFYNTFKSDAFRQVKGVRQIQSHESIPGAATETMMWSGNPQNPGDPTKLAMLTMDIIPQNSSGSGQQQYGFQPRRWLVGSNVQAVILYGMSCCAGLSALATFKQGGKIIPTLLENAKFVAPEYRDLFRLTVSDGTKSGLQIDHHGGVLSHWYDHFTGRQHDCGSKARLTIPGRLNAMTNSGPNF